MAGPNFFHVGTWAVAGGFDVQTQGSFGTEYSHKRGFECPRCGAIVIEPEVHKKWHEDNEKEG